MALGCGGGQSCGLSLDLQQSTCPDAFTAGA
jgi:hypothetical protein